MIPFYSLPESRGKGIKIRDVWFFLFVTPAFVLFLLIVVIPLFQGFAYSLTSWDGLNKAEFIGLKNFLMLFHDEVFYKSLINTLYFAVGATVFQNIAGLLLAVLLDSSISGCSFFRAVFFMPTVISPVLAGFIWSRIYSDGYPALLYLLGVQDAVSPLGDPGIVMIACIVIQIWLGSGNAMIIYIAGLQCIPVELFESARVDGANAMQQFLKIKLPMLVPSLTINFVLIGISSLKVFDIIFAATTGGPGYSSTTIAMYTYKSSYSDNNAGYGTAIGVVFFLIIFVITLMQILFFRKREVEV